jgi:DNA-binding transcriptional LysR family regulator
MRGSNRYKDLELAQLRSFCLAALQGNFTAAAKHLGLSTTTTTVWQQVRALEQRLGSRLLRVQGRTLEVTPEGKLLLDIVQPHVSGLDSLERLFQARRADLPQHLTVAATYYLFAYHLPRSLKEFAARHPDTRLNLRAGIWPDVTRLMEKGEADLGVVSYAPESPRSPHLVYERLFDLQFTLLVSADHPLARKRNLRPHDLVQYPFIMSLKETFGYRTLEAILRKHDLFDRIHVVMESPNTDLLRKYVIMGLGIALTYTCLQREEPQPGLVQRVFDPNLESLPVYLVTRKGAHLPEAVEEFRRVVRKFLSDGGREGS